MSESLFACRHHGMAYTTGCPGCAAAVEKREDHELAKTVRTRLRWWKLPNLCARVGHFWREVEEPGVFECWVCRSTLFTEACSDEAFYHVLGGHSSTCTYWISASTATATCSCGRQS